eukprot:FR740311.1.p1 GENE.FR740311.1~~FR740311.1.p1  ORF type:complete len:104 (+),score=0.75 FR740311.1:580-891(+)
MLLTGLIPGSAFDDLAILITTSALLNAATCFVLMHRSRHFLTPHHPKLLMKVQKNSAGVFGVATGCTSYESGRPMPGILTFLLPFMKGLIGPFGANNGSYLVS